MKIERGIRITVVTVNLFAALSAFAGALGLVVGYMNIPLSVLSTTPFADFTIPALLLGFVVGGSALAAALIALFGPRFSVFGAWRFDALAAWIAGCIMVGWMLIEIAMIGMAIWVQTLYLVVGLVMMGLAIWLQWAEWRPQARTSSGAGHHRLA
ncbi:MAG TPA: hypothetical protein VF808_17620 [Ktedonobacterales bacterium]